MKRLEQQRLSVRQPVERPLQQRTPLALHRCGGFVVDDRVRIVIADSLDGIVAAVVAQQPSRHAREPRGRPAWHTALLPVVDRSKPRLLRDVFGKREIPAAPPSDEVEQLVDRRSIDVSNRVFGHRLPQGVVAGPKRSSLAFTPSTRTPKKTHGRWRVIGAQRL